METIIQIESLYSISLDIKLFKGALCSVIEKENLSVEILREAYFEIDNDQKYSGDEKKYMKYFASVFGIHSITIMQLTDNPPFIINFDEVELNKVRDRIKRHLPLRDHPNWIE